MRIIYYGWLTGLSLALLIDIQIDAAQTPAASPATTQTATTPPVTPPPATPAAAAPTAGSTPAPAAQPSQSSAMQMFEQAKKSSEEEKKIATAPATQAAATPATPPTTPTPEPSPSPTASEPSPASAGQVPSQGQGQEEDTGADVATIAAPESPEEEELTIDTIDQDEPQGNWLFKKIWWQYSEQRYGKIRLALNAVEDIRTQLIAKRNALERTVLDPFYLSIGIGEGELQALIASLLENKANLAKDNKTVAMPNQQEFLDNLEKDKAELEQLQKDIKTVTTLGENLEDAMTKLMQQVQQVRKYEQDAWQYFKDVSQVLNDKKAQQLFYQIKNAAENINSILDYLKGGFSTSFDELIQKTTKQVEQVKTSLQALKEKGVILKNKGQQLEEAELAAQRAKQAALAKKAQEEEPEEEEEPPTSWTSTLTAPFVWLGNTIMAVVRAPYDLVMHFFGSNVEQEGEEEDATPESENTTQEVETTATDTAGKAR